MLLRRRRRMSSPARSALRTAASPRGLLALVLVIVAVIATVLLGRWQWERTQGILAAERAAQAARVPIADVIPGDATELPDGAYGHAVSLAGTWNPQAQAIVVNRALDGNAGVWIVTGLTLDSGGTAAVVRGWLPDATAPGAVPPTGHVEVDGVVQPEENFYAGAQESAGSIAALSNLSSALGTSVLPGYVLLTSERPVASPAPSPLPAPPPADVPFPLRNFVYAIQWWIFGLFAVVVFAWWLWRGPRERTGDPTADPGTVH